MGLAGIDIRRATIAWADWITDKWQLDLRDPQDRRFMELAADALNEILIEVRDRDRPRPWILARAAWGAWVALQDERYSRGTVAADRTLDGLLATLGSSWGAFLGEWRRAALDADPGRSPQVRPE